MPEHPRRRIALVAACPFPTSQGSQVFIHQLARALAHAGHEVDLVTYGFGETAGVPSHRLRAGPSFEKPLWDALLALRL